MDASRAALAQLYQDVGPQIWSYIRRRSIRQDEADEILQDTFLIVARRQEDLLKAQSKKAWLIGIARNLLRERGRRKRRGAVTQLAQDPPTPVEEPEDARLDSVRSAIARLPDQQREVIEMRIEHDLSYAEIAVAMAIPIGTVRSRLHHAVRAVRETIQSTDINRCKRTEGTASRAFGD